MLNYSSRYPHKLYKLVVGETTIINDFGQEEVVEGDSELVYVCVCYEQPLGESKEYKKANGSSYYVSSKIFLPIVSDIAIGTIIEVREEDETLRFKGEVKRNSNEDKKGSRLWV